METFKRITEYRTSDLTDRYARKILTSFKKVYAEYIYQRRQARKPNSMLIKHTLVNLGHKLKFRVYANGLRDDLLNDQCDKYGFVNREFLYDVHWYKDKKDCHYMPETIPLVVESELGDRRKGDRSGCKSPAVMFDFQKLLVANAELRMLVFKVYQQTELAKLNEYFEEAIRTYRLIAKGSAFFFVCFDHSSKMIYYCEKVK